MDKTLEQALGVFVTELTKTFTSLKDYGIEQFPSVVQEFMQYEAVRVNTWFWVMLCMSILFGVLTIILFLASLSGEGEGMLLFLLLTIITALPAVDFHLDSVKLKTAPKVYILEKMMNMVKY